MKVLISFLTSCYLAGFFDGYILSMKEQSFSFDYIIDGPNCAPALHCTVRVEKRAKVKDKLGN